MANGEKKQSMGVRFVELRALIKNMEATAATLKRFHHDLLVQLACVARFDGWDVDINMMSDNSIRVMWKKKDAKTAISKEEENEVDFRCNNICALGWRTIGGPDHHGHAISYDFQAVQR